MAFTSIRVREAWNWSGLSFWQLLVRTYKAMCEHDTLNQAAGVAFYGMMSMVPLLGLVLALSLGARTGVAGQIDDVSQIMLPHQAHALLSDQIHKIESENSVGLLSLSIVLLLWSASSLFTAVMGTTNTAFGVRDSRPWWKQKILAIVLTVAEAVLLLVASLSIALWPEAAGWLGLSGLARLVYTGVQWFVVVLVLLTGFALAYHFGPSVKQEWQWITPGSALGALVLIAASVGFREYLVHFGSSYNETYGALAGVVLMMLWFYLAALALLVGAEVNCIIVKAAMQRKSIVQKDSPSFKTAP